MPLSPPVTPRQPRHIRRVHYRSFERSDGLWDIEGELIDTKAMDIPRLGKRSIYKAGTPIHHMHIRVTIDTSLVVHDIEAVMDAHPIQDCPGALDAMQKMVGCCMAQGWRKSIEQHLRGIAGCTHMRELLNNMATAAFQSITSAFISSPNTPPSYLGHCKGWDFNGTGVSEFYPEFINYKLTEKYTG